MVGNREKRTTIGGQFAPRRIDMLSSPAYRVLSLSARRVLDRLEIEMAGHGGTDNGRLPCTYDDFQRYGIDRHSIAPAIREAEALGFIEITQRGCAGNAEWRSPNYFRLTYRHTKNSKSDGTHEWQKIGTIEQATKLAKIARARTMPGRASPVGANTRFSAGNRHRNSHFHSGETHTTGHSGKTDTTFDISGMEQLPVGTPTQDKKREKERPVVKRPILKSSKNGRGRFPGLNGSGRASE
jgi:hypothetical protein